MRGEKCKNRGSITVEASILVPFIIISISAVIYLGLILYQRAMLQSIADMTARAGAATWSNISSDIATGKIGVGKLDDERLYWRFFDTDKSDKLERIKKYTLELVNNRLIFYPADQNVNVDIKDYIIYKRLCITIECYYYVPCSSLFKIFGFDGKYKLNAVSYSNIDKPTEFVRNIDLILDIEKGLENKYPALKDMGEKSREVFAKIKENIDKFTK